MKSLDDVLNISEAHSFTEDASLPGDNGSYLHECRQCGVAFIGHKRRLQCCKICLVAFEERELQRKWNEALAKESEAIKCRKAISWRLRKKRNERNALVQ